MIENYRILARTGGAEGTGEYEITKRGTRKEITKFVERYKTSAGVFLPEEWKEKAMKAIKEEGKTEFWESVKEYCRGYCAWLHEEEKIEEYAVECLCNGAYMHWENFKNNENQDLGGQQDG